MDQWFSKLLVSKYRVWRSGTKAERTFLVRLHHWWRLSTRWEWVRGMCTRCTVKEDGGCGLAVSFAWRKAGIRLRRCLGRPLGRGTGADHLALGGGPSRTRWKQLERHGTSCGALCSPSGAPRIEWVSEMFLKKSHIFPVLCSCRTVCVAVCQNK